MKKFSRYLLYIALIVLAIVSYSLGSAHSTFFLIVLGFAFELSLWLIAFRNHKKHKGDLP